MSGNPHAADLKRAVFGGSKIMGQLDTEARNRLVSPWALLAGALTRAALATPCNYRLPVIVQGDAGLNQLFVTAGPSGAGKGASREDVYSWPRGDLFDLKEGEQVLEDVFSPITVASGEAFGSLFVENQSVPGVDGKGRVTVPVRIRHAAWADFDEVDQFAAIGSRQGATLSAEVRKAWSGAGIGTYTKVKANRASVRAHSYRLVVTVAAQPLRSAPLLAEEAGGTLQRILWFSADTPDLEDPGEDPDSSPLGIVLPNFEREGVHYFDVAGAVRAEIKADRIARRWHGTEDAHRNLVKLKAAAACAVLHGTTEVTETTWAWAEALMTHSERVRASVRADLAHEEEAKATRRAALAAHGDIAKASATEITVLKVAKAIERVMRKQPQAAYTEGLLKSKVTGVWRSLVPEAVELLVDRGEIRSAGDVTRKGSTAYVLVV